MKSQLNPLFSPPPPPSALARALARAAHRLARVTSAAGLGTALLLATLLSGCSDGDETVKRIELTPKGSATATEAQQRSSFPAPGPGDRPSDPVSIQDTNAEELPTGSQDRDGSGESR